MHIIKANNISQAWLHGCKYILNHGFRTKKKIKLHNLILHIKNAIIDSRIDYEFREHMNMDIFNRTLDVVTSDKSFGSHPNYWRRLTGQDNVFGVDQLNNIISRLKKQPNSTKLTLCIYTPHDFNKQYIPCILCVELRTYNKCLNMSVFIRSQDFANKSYADYIGLSRILNKITQATNMNPGTINAYVVTAFISRYNINRINNVFDRI